MLTVSLGIHVELVEAFNTVLFKGQRAEKRHGMVSCVTVFPVVSCDLLVSQKLFQWS